MDRPFTSYQIEERSYVAYIKREIHRQLSSSGFSETRVGEIDIIVAELSSNLIKHAGKGEFLYRITTDEAVSKFELICIDKGSGMTNPSRMMKDGVSTAGTLGNGLGAIQRLSDKFQLYTIPNWGTVIYSIVEREKPASAPTVTAHLDVKSLCVCKPREDVSGDGFHMKQRDGIIYVFLGDGLGHGVYANEAVNRAAEAFEECDDVEPSDMLRFIHGKVKRTRGLVAAIAALDLNARSWRICAVGNILTRLYSGITSKNYMSYNGTIGLNIPSTIHDSVFAAEKNQHLLMCSDGIRGRYDLMRYPAIMKHDPMIMASCIYKDFTRGNDDASIVVARLQ